MKFIFKERKEDGVPDSEFVVDTQDYESDSLETLIVDKNYVIGRAGKTESTLTAHILETVTKEMTVPNVLFDVHASSPIIGGSQAISVYWIEEAGTWIAFGSYSEMVSSHASAECHSGPYKIEGIIAEKLLEVYGLDQSLLGGKALRQVSPSLLEKLTKEKNKVHVQNIYEKLKEKNADHYQVTIREVDGTVIIHTHYDMMLDPYKFETQETTIHFPRKDLYLAVTTALLEGEAQITTKGRLNHLHDKGDSYCDDYEIIKKVEGIVDVTLKLKFVDGVPDFSYTTQQNPST